MKIRNLIALLLCLLLLFSAVGCSASTADQEGGMAVGDAAAKAELAAESEASAALPENRKLIQTVRMRVETEDMDAVVTQINERLTALGGYIESSNVQNGSAYNSKRTRNASVTVRIPADKLPDFTERIREVTNVVSSEKTVEDVTLSYVATESRVKALQTEEARLLALMAEADTMADLLTVEKRLTEVRTELEKVTSTLRIYDNRVEYATVHLTVQEVKEYTDTEEEKTLWEEIGSGFVKSLKNVGTILRELFIFLFVALPYLLPLILIAAVALVLLRVHNRKKSKKNDQTPPHQP